MVVQAGDGARRASPHAAPVETRVDFALAREIATREGIKAVIDGSLSVSAGDTSSRCASCRRRRARAGDLPRDGGQPVELLPTVDRLRRRSARRSASRSEACRARPARAGDDLVARGPQEVRAGHAADRRGATSARRALLEEAVAIDTASRWRIASSASSTATATCAEKAAELLREGVAHIGPAQRRRAYAAPRQLLLARQAPGRAKSDAPTSSSSRSSRTTRRR
jgi:hypothetical protein